MASETNIFPILNLDQLSSTYYLYKIKGLLNAPDEYYQNRQLIVEKLGYSLQNAVTIIDREDGPYLTVNTEGRQPQPHLSAIRTTVQFEKFQDTFYLDYTKRSPDNDAICVKFLDFWLQGVLYKRETELWQPSAGQPWFEKQAERFVKTTARYLGYSIRATVTQDGGLGFCIDVTHKFLSRNPLPNIISFDEFNRKWKNRHFIYRYGHQWYDVQLTGLSDQNATEYLVQNTPLIKWARQECRKPLPEELVQLPHDVPVVLYRNNRGDTRGALAPLCYSVLHTSDDHAGEQHGNTILPPHVRRKQISDFVRDTLSGLSFGKIALDVSPRSTSATTKLFIVPDLKFGHNKVLSVKSTPNTQHTGLDALGTARLALLRDKTAGFFHQEPLERQYLVLPETIADSMGKAFLKDLQEAVRNLFPHSYNPVEVKYDDNVAKTFPKQGNAILDAVRRECVKPGFAVVMIHETIDRQSRDEDQLAAMVIRELDQLKPQITAAVIHSTVVQECYELVQKGKELEYRVREDKRGLLSGYLRMVAINKVLLTNERWPFVLATRTNADLTIGLDVKENTAGLVIIGAQGADIRTLFKTSNRKEKLTKDQMAAYLIDIITKEIQDHTTPIKSIVLQRDGRVYDTEIAGCHEALARLKQHNILPADANITILEIGKTSLVRFRLFDVIDKAGKPWVENPEVGTYYLINDTEGYLCTTGRAFPRKGTVNPLHVRLVEGPLPLEKCLEDIFYLSCLAWTRPEDCSRLPITSKLNDRFLSEEATEYDANALEVAAILSGEMENLDE